MITTIVPIHGAPEHLDACLASLTRTLTADRALLLIDDASPDADAIECVVNTHLPRLPRETRFMRQSENQGFVATVNAGMAACAGDVILLNSDTVTTTGWIEAMQTCAAHDARIATITPWSNHAEICSIPNFCEANPIPADAEAIADALAELHPTNYPDLPTAVGFCMYIRRACLDAIGDFDAASFGRGYGEENDFCCRASGHGWRHVLCPDAYVVHAGGASFGPLGLKPGGLALQTLSARYPGYCAQIAEFIARDPLAEWRAIVRERLQTAGVAWDSQESAKQAPPAPSQAAC